MLRAELHFYFWGWTGIKVVCIAMFSASYAPEYVLGIIPEAMHIPNRYIHICSCMRGGGGGGYTMLQQPFNLPCCLQPSFLLSGLLMLQTHNQKRTKKPTTILFQRKYFFFKFFYTRTE